MCEPATIALSLAVIGGVANIAQETAAIQAQNDAVNAEIKNADIAYGINMNMFDQQAREIGQQQDMEAFERSRQALRERSKMAVAMGESGVSGNSPMREMANSFLQQSYDLGMLATNKENALGNVQNQRMAAGENTRARIANAENQWVNPGLARLRIGGAALGAASKTVNAGYTYGVWQ